MFVGSDMCPKVEHPKFFASNVPMYHCRPNRGKHPFLHVLITSWLYLVGRGWGGQLFLVSLVPRFFREYMSLWPLKADLDYLCSGVPLIHKFLMQLAFVTEKPLSAYSGHQRLIAEKKINNPRRNKQSVFG